jgi:hypothetical protein
MAENNNNQNMMMDWNDSIENDGQEFVLLPEGDYNFVVTNFERGRFPGGAKVPACNKASITVQVNAPEGVSIIKFDLLLYRTLEWRVSAFFRSIGQKKHGEKLTMDWNKVIGSQSRAHFKQRTYVNQSGDEKTVNDLDRFIDYDPTFFMVEINDEELPF